MHNSADVTYTINIHAVHMQYILLFTGVKNSCNSHEKLPNHFKEHLVFSMFFMWLLTLCTFHRQLLNIISTLQGVQLTPNDDSFYCNRFLRIGRCLSSSFWAPAAGAASHWKVCHVLHYLGTDAAFKLKYFFIIMRIM